MGETYLGPAENGMYIYGCLGLGSSDKNRDGKNSWKIIFFFKFTNLKFESFWFFTFFFFDWFKTEDQKFKVI